MYKRQVNIQSGSSYISSIYRFADSIKNIYKNVYSEQNAGIMQSIVLGDRSGLDDDVKRMYPVSYTHLQSSHIIFQLYAAMKPDIP